MAVKELTGRLIAILVVAFVSILGLVFIVPALKMVGSLGLLEDTGKQVANALLTGGLVYVIGLALVRTYALVESDRSVLDVQSDILVKSAERRLAKEKRAEQAKHDEEAPFTQPENYGRRLDH